MITCRKWIRNEWPSLSFLYLILSYLHWKAWGPKDLGAHDFHPTSSDLRSTDSGCRARSGPLRWLTRLLPKAWVLHPILRVLCSNLTDDSTSSSLTLGSLRPIRHPLLHPQVLARRHLDIRPWEWMPSWTGGWLPKLYLRLPYDFILPSQAYDLRSTTTIDLTT